MLQKGSCQDSSGQVDPNLPSPVSFNTFCHQAVQLCPFTFSFNYSKQETSWEFFIWSRKSLEMAFPSSW